MTKPLNHSQIHTINMSPKPHVEITAIIPDDQGRIVIGKKKGKNAGTLLAVITALNRNES